MSKFITKKEAEKVFRRDYLPEIRQREAQFPNMGIDTVMRRTAWNDMVDSLNKAGYVSDNQVMNWTNPYNI